MGITAAVGIAAAGKIYAGNQQKAADNATAQELANEGGQSIAAGIQGAIAQRRRGDYVASQARARIAAGGLTTTGTSAISTIGGIKGQGEYNALTDIYQGEDRANELDFKGQVLKSEGQAAQTAGILSALSGGESFYSKYAA